ncbi:PH domain-containing protein [Streptomyces sp. NPDC004685]
MVMTGRWTNFRCAARWAIQRTCLLGLLARQLPHTGLPGLTRADSPTFAFGFLLRRVEAGPDGLRYRTVLRWHRLEWDEIVRLQEIQVMPNDRRQKTPNVRVEATLRSGEAVRLPVPWFGAVDAITFEGELRKLRAVRRHYTPTSH